MMKIILNNEVVDGVPLIEYYQEDITYRSLVFVQHGYESTKEYGSDYLAIDLARKGYFVVAIDAYKHGERIKEPFITGTARERLDEAFTIVKRTALDIIRLHHNRYRRFSTFDIIGVSLGGMVAYYAATKTQHIRKLIPVISTPDFMSLSYHAVAQAEYDVEEYFTEDKLDFIQSINPLTHTKQMRFKELHIFCGTKDDVVPMQPSIEFFNQFDTEYVTLHTYDVGHSVPRYMQQDIYQELDK